MRLISKTELRKHSTEVELLLMAGEEIVLTSYGKAIGLITPNLPDGVSEMVERKQRESLSYKLI
jgi:antitoxin (DNA-binding transcriptional repressor) of toxin-antitoxin stability system